MARSDDNLRVITGEGKTKKPAQERRISFIVLGIFAFVLIMVGYQWVNSWLYFRRVQVEVAEVGSIKSTVNIEGVITRHEEIVTSPEDGVVLGKIPEGERVSVDGEVITLLQDYYQEEAVSGEDGREESWLQETYEEVQGWIESLFDGEESEDEENDDSEEIQLPDLEEYISVHSPKAGVVSYHVDGLEDKYLPDYPYDIFQAGKEIPKAGDSLERKDFVNEGEPVFKVVDNWKWYYSLAVEADKGEKIQDQPEATLTFSFAPEREVEAELVDVHTDADAGETYITYKIHQQIPGFSRYRIAEADLHYYTHEGVRISEEALMQKEGEQGVFVNERGIATFYPVEIQASAEGKVIIEGISAGDIIIERPDLVSEGQRME